MTESEEKVMKTSFTLSGAAIPDSAFAATLGGHIGAAEVDLSPPALRVLKRVAAFLSRSPFFNPGNMLVSYDATADIDERGRGTIALNVTIEEGPAMETLPAEEEA